jgi:hypothetical protein
VPSSGGTTGSASGDRVSWPEGESPASTDMSVGKGADARGETAVPGTRTRCFFERLSDQPTAKVAGGGLAETALTDASMASRVVQSAADAGAAGAAGALGLRAVCRGGAAGMVGAAAAAGVGALVRPGGAATGARD